MEKYIEDERIHEGHRARMRAKLMAHGQYIFDTYELLEMLLYHTVPYKDTNPIAKRLLCSFGSLDGVLSADPKELTSVCGVGERTAEFISSVGRLSHIIGAEILPKDKYDFSSYDGVGRFFLNYFSDMTEKCVAAVFLDNNMRFIEVKRMYDVEYESGGVKAKRFIDTALQNHASVIISAHNHPYGPFYPSEGDRATNAMLTSSLNMVGLIHAEHYIVCGNSYAGIGCIDNFTKKLSQSYAVGEFFESKSRGDESLPRDVGGTATADSHAEVGRAYNQRDFDYFVSLLSFMRGDDAKETARNLLSRYLTIENIITAKFNEIATLTDDKYAFYLKLLGYIVSRRVTDGFKKGEVYTSAQISDYLKARFIGVSVEQILMITFDSKRRFINCVALGEGTVNLSELLPRKAVEVAVLDSASYVVISHNHPFGNTTPSMDDVKLTGVLESLFSSCEIGLIGHYIIAGQRCEIITPNNREENIDSLI